MASTPSVATEILDKLALGIETPISAGFRLTYTSLRPLVLHSLPLLIPMAAIMSWQGVSLADVELMQRSSVPMTAAFILLALYAMVLVGSILSQRYTGLVIENPYVHALKRLVPWLFTWLMVSVIVFGGYLLFVIPGVYAGLRLFWADEFALVHETWPWKAIGSSWQLTQENPGLLMFELRVGLITTGLMLVASLGVGGWLQLMQWLGWARFAAHSGNLIFLLVAILIYSSFHAIQLVLFYGMWALEGGEP